KDCNYTAVTANLNEDPELQHLPWPDKSPDLNIIKPLWAVLKRRVRSRFLLPTSLKQLADVFLGSIQLETIQKLYGPIVCSFYLT
uniref:Tc1-like transposase DDE domain-containing protein n=1 Tax=Sinocyclocheilus grahami TaxID=75366 RepID=A0A672K6I0_SINGR